MAHPLAAAVQQAGGIGLPLGPEAPQWKAPTTGLPLAHEVLGIETLHRFGIWTEGAMLVRPDGFVAWRAADDADATPEEISRVVGVAIAAQQ